MLAWPRSVMTAEQVSCAICGKRFSPRFTLPDGTNTRRLSLLLLADLSVARAQSAEGRPRPVRPNQRRGGASAHPHGADDVVRAAQERARRPAPGSGLTHRSIAEVPGRRRARPTCRTAPTHRGRLRSHSSARAPAAARSQGRAIGASAGRGREDGAHGSLDHGAGAYAAAEPAAGE